MDYIIEDKSNLGLDMQAINKWKHGKCLPDIENMYILSQILGKKLMIYLYLELTYANL